MLRWWGQVGSEVVFKKDRKQQLIWEVAAIEDDVDKVHWSNDGITPNYIQLKTLGRDGEVHHCWTCENKLLPYLRIKPQ